MPWGGRIRSLSQRAFTSVSHFYRLLSYRPLEGCEAELTAAAALIRTRDFAIGDPVRHAPHGHIE